MADVLLSINQGQLRGKVATDHKGQTYYSFKGIPYAKPPVGELRFKAPLPPEPWEGIRDAIKEGNRCFHRDTFTRVHVGSEDCLFINVYTPKLPDHTNNGLKSVMVYIHGGAFRTGSGDADVYGPDFLVAEDVIIVTFNYRIGLLGFLSFSDPSLGVPGNAGLKDQVLALKWVQQNIEKFGGDPNSVTIFGESAGAASVHLLVLSPMAKGLFHRAIAQSGCAINPWVMTPNGGGEKVAALLGFESTNQKDVLDFLRKAPLEKFHVAQEAVVKEHRGFNFGGPTVEVPSENEPAFLSESPLSVLRKGTYNHVPLLMGCTTDEGLLMLAPGQMGLVKPNFTNNECLIPWAFKMTPKAPETKAVGDKIKKFYYGDETPSEENIKFFVNHQTDSLFAFGVYAVTKGHVATSKEPVYHYLFALETKLNFLKHLMQIKLPGVCHAEDLAYMFKSIISPAVEPGSQEDIAMKRVIKLWTNFAKTGNPNPVEKDPLIDVKWEPVTKEQFNYIILDNTLATGNTVPERVKFWDELYTAQGIKLF